MYIYDMTVFKSIGDTFKGSTTIVVSVAVSLETDGCCLEEIGKLVIRLFPQIDS